MFFAYKMVADVKNPTVKRIAYHLIQLAVGCGLGLLCNYFTQTIISPSIDSKQLMIVSGSMALGWLVLSFGWYNKEKQFYEEQRNK